MPHFERLYNFACWLTHDRQEAEDLVQETYAKALKGFSCFQPGTNFRAWIYKILRNAFLSSRTGLKATATVPLDLRAERKPCPQSRKRRRAFCCSVRIGSLCSRLWSNCPSPIARCCCFVKSNRCRIRKSPTRLPSRWAQLCRVYRVPEKRYAMAYGHSFKNQTVNYGL
jgi:hypothetical protein